MAKNRLYIIRKYIMAPSASEAIKKEKNHKADDVWLDEDWKRSNPENAESTKLGFNK